MARLVGDSRRMVRACWAHTAKHKETHTTSAGLHKETQMKAHTANHERTIERLHDRVGRRRCTGGEKIIQPISNPSGPDTPMILTPLVECMAWF